MPRTFGRPMARRAVRACGLLACAALLAVAQTKPIPQLVKKDGKFTFLVDGKPFIMLGFSVGNFSALPDRMERARDSFRAMNLNTVEYPVYWNVIEPAEGRFDFSGFDQILRGIRAQGLRAVILWFGTWKNGAMDWTPNWVKADPARFPRVIGPGGKPIRVLSPHSRANLEAVRKAYVAMMRNLREIDEADRTVIMVQVENEPGLLGSPRDYSAESNRLFAGPVPEKLVAALKRKPGSWKDVFGREAEEAFSAYAVSGYINEVAAAGKAVYPLPAYVNVQVNRLGSAARQSKTLPGLVLDGLVRGVVIQHDVVAVQAAPRRPASIHVRAFFQLRNRGRRPTRSIERGLQAAAQNHVVVRSGRNHDGIRGCLRSGAGPTRRGPPWRRRRSRRRLPYPPH